MKTPLKFETGLTRHRSIRKIVLVVALAGAVFAGITLFFAGLLYRVSGGGLTIGTTREEMADIIYLGALVIPVGMASWCLWTALWTPRGERLGLVAFGIPIILVLVVPFIRAIALIAHTI